MTEATRGTSPYPPAPDLDSLRRDIQTTYGRCLHELHAAEAASLVGDSHSRDVAVTAPTLPIETELSALVRTLSLLAAAYEEQPLPSDLDTASYTAGFRNGARSAYADAVARIREARVMATTEGAQTCTGRDDRIHHQFLPVDGHPDDDECTHRADGTDATYCGMPEAAHEDCTDEPIDYDPTPHYGNADDGDVA